MAKLAALGDGPIEFFTDGVQVEVPLSAIYFENDEVRTTRTDLPTPDFDNWLKFLASRGRLVAGVAPPVEKAMVVNAVAPGSAGNDIQLKVEAKSLPGVTPVTVDVTVTETDRYPGLTLAALVTQLGIAGAASGTKPGLLTFTNQPGSAALPVEGAPSIQMTAGAPPTWKIAGAGLTAVTLQPRRPGSEFDAATGVAGSKTVSITDAPLVPTAGATFTLTVTWTRIVRDVALTNISTKLAELGYLVTFTAPDGTAITNITKLPRPGTVTLTGGSELVAATQASATVMANE